MDMIHNGENVVFVDQIVDQFKELEDPKQPIILVFSGSSVINNGVCIQLGSTAEELREALEKVPPEAIGELLKAIGVVISKIKP
jgi:hypothetical protein